MQINDFINNQPCTPEDATIFQEVEENALFADELDRINSYKEVFGSDMGQNVLKDLIDICGLFRSSFRPNDANHTAFNAGKQFVGQAVLSILHAKIEPIEEK